MAVMVARWMAGANETVTDNSLVPKVVEYVEGDLMLSLLYLCRVDRCSNLTSKSKLPVCVREQENLVPASKQNARPSPPSANHVIPQA